MALIHLGNGITVEREYTELEKIEIQKCLDRLKFRPFKQRRIMKTNNIIKSEESC